MRKPLQITSGLKMEEEDKVKEDEGRKAWLTQEQGEQDKSSQENREET
jgi:hypothetical protein